MELKDWIILLIPIICNGLFIFCFQLAISHKLQKIEKRDLFVSKNINSLSEMVCKQYNHLITLINECSSGYNNPNTMKPAPFEKLWNPIADETVKIYNFYQIHKTIFQNNNISIDAYANSYEQLATTLTHKINRLLTDEDKQEIFQKITIFKSNILSFNAQLEQKICKK